MDKRFHLETIAITAGRPTPIADGPVNPPISLNSTLHAGGPIGYGRYGNETWTALEDAMSDIANEANSQTSNSELEESSASGD